MRNDVPLVYWHKNKDIKTETNLATWILASKLIKIHHKSYHKPKTTVKATISQKLPQKLP